MVYAAALGLLYAAVVGVFDRATGTLTAVVCLLSLSELYFINLASTEVLGAFFIAAVFLAMSGGLPSRMAVVRLGLLGGLAAYNRPNILPIGALAFAQQLLMEGKWGNALRKGVAIQLLTIAVTLPLCLFNYERFGRFTPLLSNAATLWYGNNPKLSGDFHTYAPTPEDFAIGSPERVRLRRELAPVYSNSDSGMEFSKMGPYQVDDVRTRYAIAWIRQHPGRYLQLIWARFQLFFFSCTYGEAPYRTAHDRTNPQQPLWAPAHERLIEHARLPIRELYQILISGSALGLLATVVRYGPKAFLTSTKSLPLLIVAYYATPFLLTTAANRYHIPILCLCWVYLAHGMVILGRSLRPSAQAGFSHAPAA